MANPSVEPFSSDTQDTNPVAGEKRTGDLTNPVAARRWTVSEIDTLIKLCRDRGVRHFRGEGLEFSFERNKRDGEAD